MLNSKGANGVIAKADKYQHQLAQVNTNLRAANSYPSPSELQQPMSRMGYSDRPYDGLYAHPPSYDQPRLPGQGSPTDEEISPASANAKTFPCATCAKGKNGSPQKLLNCHTEMLQVSPDAPIWLVTNGSIRETGLMVSRE